MTDAAKKIQPPDTTFTKLFIIQAAIFTVACFGIAGVLLVVEFVGRLVV